MNDIRHHLAAVGVRVWFAAVVCAALAAAVLPLDQPVAAAVRDLTLENQHFIVRLAGDLGHGVTLAVAFAALIVLYGEERTGIGGMLGLLGAGLVVAGARALIGRTRPDGGEFSFPSAHAACAFAAATVLAHRWPRRWYAFYLAAAGVALSRVLMLRHFPSDVLAGAALGLAFGAVAAALADMMPAIRDAHAARWVKAILAAVLVTSLAMTRHRPEPLASVAAPAVLLVLARRAALVGFGLDEAARQGRAILGHWTGKIGIGLFALAALVAAAAFCAYPYAHGLGDHAVPPCFAVAALLVTMVVLALRDLLRRRNSLLAAELAVGAIMLALLIWLSVLPAIHAALAHGQTGA